MRMAIPPITPPTMPSIDVLFEDGLLEISASASFGFRLKGRYVSRIQLIVVKAYLRASNENIAPCAGLHR
jgi:hypothetical protein